MTELERLAKKFFEAYAKKSKAVGANWAFLQAERKLEWMKEVALIYDLVLGTLDDKMRPVPGHNLGTASYERGFNDGTRSERMALKDMVQTIRKDLDYQMDLFIEQNKEKVRRR